MNQKFYDKTALRVHVMSAFFWGGGTRRYTSIEKWKSILLLLIMFEETFLVFKMFETLWHRGFMNQFTSK